MLNISNILENILLEEKVDGNKVKNAINDKYRVIINYNSHGEDIAMGWRIIEVYAYGLTKAGNQVIRAYQPKGDTASDVPSWKFFRLDRILDWKPTGQHFNTPRPKFNPNGDKSMSIVYSIADFNDNVPDTKTPVTAEPRKKEEPVFTPPGETQTRQGLNHMRKQLDTPVYYDDFINNKKTQDGFKGSDVKNNNLQKQSTGPKKKTEEPLINNPQNNILNKTTNQNNDVFKAPGYQQEKDKLNNLKNNIEKSNFVDPSVLKDYEKNKNKRNNIKL